MQSTDDSALLQQYLEDNSDAAFAALVTRHINLVYSVALRHVADPHLAEEITQAVFILLTKKAAELRHDKALSSWLFQATRLTASNFMRSETRRHRREQEAHMQSVLDESGDDVWRQISPLLDTAVATLSETDRQAIVLRFYEGRNLRDVGAALGASEDAAEKRVSRAVERLREYFNKRGVTVGASGLAIVISANAVQAAPVGLAVTISTAAALAGTTIATTATVIATKAIAMTALQKTIVTATIAALAGAGIYEARQASQLRERNQALQQQQVEQIQQLRSERDAATNQLAAMMDEMAKIENNNLELLRLRNEATRLRRESQELAQAASHAATKDEGESAEKSLLDRVKLLKQRLEQVPSERNPEIQFLTEFDWLGAAKRKLDTDGDYRAAFSELRASGEHHFLQMAETALRKYLATNSQVFPTEMSQLTPFFDNPLSDDVLQRYHVVPKDSVPQATISGPPGGWLITLKTPDSEAFYMLGTNGLGGIHYDESNSMGILAPALKAALEAAPEINGRKNIGLPEVEPHLTTPEQKAAFQRLMKGHKPTTP